MNTTNQATNATLVPVLCISTNETGSHLTLYPVGTRSDLLVHDYGRDGNPTYAEGVYVEMVTPEQASQVRAAKLGDFRFSSTEEFNEWLCML